MAALNNKPELEVRCVWPDYQVIKAPVDINPQILERIELLKERLVQDFRINRILLINDVIYPFNNIARDVLKFDIAAIKRLSDKKREELFNIMEEMAEQLVIDPATPTQAVHWHDDIYLLMSAQAIVLKTSENH